MLTDHNAADRVAAALTAAGYDTKPLTDSMKALHTLEGAERIELLVTCANFGLGQPNGIALTRMARTRKPGIRVLFVGEPDLAHQMEGLGAFLASPVDAAQIVHKAIEMLEESGRD